MAKYYFSIHTALKKLRSLRYVYLISNSNIKMEKK